MSGSEAVNGTPTEAVPSTAETRYGAAAQRFANALGRTTVREGGIDPVALKISVELTAGFLDVVTEHLASLGLVVRDDIFNKAAERFELSAQVLEKPSLVIAQGGKRQ